MKIEKIKQEALKTGLKGFYGYVRNYYLEKNGFEKEEIKTDENLERLVNGASKLLKTDKEKLWESKAFHLNFRVTDIESLSNLGVNKKLVSNAKKSVENGRDMSILPLNAVIGGDTIKKYIPSVPELYEKTKKHSLDPYGIFRNCDKINAVIEGKDGKYSSKLLASRKFDYAVLANITSDCPTGCASCYKGVITRLNKLALAEIDPRYKEIKKQLDQNEKEAVKQASLLTKWLNNHKEVDTVIISGGEPLIYSAKTVGNILDEISNAKYLKAVRICTSSVYQGSFFNITEELIDKFKEFARKNDGRKNNKKQLYINAHVTDENQILAPEARIVTEKLKNAGLSIHLQMPIQEGINFYRNDIRKSAEKLEKICNAAYETGAVPYKAIVDMHSPEHSALTVPIEKVSETISFLDSHFKTSDMTRWQAYNILTEQGNAYIYPKPHFAAEKEVSKDRVTYFLPKIDGKKITIHTYEEPRLEGINDKDSLAKITDKRVLKKISEVKGAYKKLKANEISTKEFYRTSGIKFSKNKPLIVENC